jgi:hypothetical protein
MAVIEIAKIQVRRGQENQTGIPQLAGGEFAWAEDTENLYIGLKREDGGARDANIRVLTENDIRLFNAFVSNAQLNASYTWELDNAPTITSTSSYDAKVVRSAQNKLDDFVTLADFGAIGTTSTDAIDITETLQLAVDHLFLDKNITDLTTYDTWGSKRYNKRLHIPAGVYRVGGTVFIPRNTVIVGEGIDKTIIENITTGSGIFQTVDYYARRADVTLGKFSANTGSNATTISGGGQPNNIHIEGMTLRYSTATSMTPHLSLLSLDCVDGGVVREVKFEGHHDGQTTAADPGYTGIDIRGYAECSSKNIVIDNCQFNGLYYDIRSNYDTNHVVIQNNIFKYSAYGIGLSTTTNFLATSGPKYYQITNNKFESIERQGIYVGANTTGEATGHVSQNNSFILVGNNGYYENGNNGVSVIKFSTPGNASVNDYFERQTWHNNNFNTATNYYPLIEGRATIDLNSVTTSTLAANTQTTIMKLPITGNAQYLNIKYNCTAYDGSVNKTGNLQIYIRPGSTPADVKLLDDYNAYGSDGGIYWGVSVEPTYKYYQILGVNQTLASPVQVELQTKLML